MVFQSGKGVATLTAPDRLETDSLADVLRGINLKSICLTGGPNHGCYFCLVMLAMEKDFLLYGEDMQRDYFANREDGTPSSLLKR